MPMNKVAGGVLPFLVAQTTVLALLVIFPEIVLLPLKWMTQ
jgi:TRAP-type C4-dicarboxylate transport system permease large subunit